MRRERVITTRPSSKDRAVLCVMIFKTKAKTNNDRQMALETKNMEIIIVQVYNYWVRITARPLGYHFCLSPSPCSEVVQLPVVWRLRQYTASMSVNLLLKVPQGYDTYYNTVNGE